MKSRSGLAPDKKPQWCNIFDPIFNDANSGLDNIVSNSNDTPFVKENYPGSGVSNKFSNSNNEE